MVWATLPRRAKIWRLAHAVWSVAQFIGLVTIWRSAIKRRRRPSVWASVAFLVAEGGGLLIGRGSCPMSGVQEKWGDPVPFFELVLPPRAAKAAVPVLAFVSLLGIGALVVRRPGLVLRA